MDIKIVSIFEKMNKIGKVDVLTTFSLTVIFVMSEAFIFPRLTTRFCYNSPDPSRVNSQCVLCNYFLFDSMVLGCTGSSALTMNITAEQAFCVISQCLGQIRQAPIFLGRKKRSTKEETSEIRKIFLSNQNLNNGQESNNDKEDLIEYTLNGEKKSYLVKKEIDAFVVDLPENF